MVIWYIFPLFLVCCTKKNLATLASPGINNNDWEGKRAFFTQPIRLFASWELGGQARDE
jgi:hypothetical protein